MRLCYQYCTSGKQHASWRSRLRPEVTHNPCLIQMPRTCAELGWTRSIHVPRTPPNQPVWPITWRAEGGLISRWVPSKGQPARRWNHSIMDEKCLRKHSRHGNVQWLLMLTFVTDQLIWAQSPWVTDSMWLQITCALILYGKLWTWKFGSRQMVRMDFW